MIIQSLNCPAFCAEYLAILNGFRPLNFVILIGRAVLTPLCPVSTDHRIFIGFCRAVFGMC